MAPLVVSTRMCQYYLLQYQLRFLPPITFRSAVEHRRLRAPESGLQQEMSDTTGFSVHPGSGREPALPGALLQLLVLQLL